MGEGRIGVVVAVVVAVAVDDEEKDGTVSSSSNTTGTSIGKEATVEDESNASNVRCVIFGTADDDM